MSDMTEMRTIDDILRDKAGAVPSAFTIEPPQVDGYPVNSDDGSMNLYYRSGDTAQLAVKENGEPAAEVDLELDADELLELAKTAVRVLAAMGERNAIAELIADAATEMV